MSNTNAAREFYTSELATLTTARDEAEVAGDYAECRDLDAEIEIVRENLAAL